MQNTYYGIYYVDVLELSGIWWENFKVRPEWETNLLHRPSPAVHTQWLPNSNGIWACRKPSPVQDTSQSKFNFYTLQSG